MSISSFLDKLMQVKRTPKQIANVFGEDSLRLGVIHACEKRVGLKVVVIYCFEGKNGNKPAFHGWCDTEKKLTEWIGERFPKSKLGPYTDMDKMLDALEGMMNH